jgi:copper chaperone NosL
MKKLAFVIIFSCMNLLPAFQALAGQPAPVASPSECSCSECGMQIRGEAQKFVSEIIFKDGKTAYFCDLGDLFVYYEVLKKKQDIAAIYVKDYLTGAWTDARTGYYLTKTNVVTPMRYGILSFKDKAGAEGFKKEKGGEGVYTFDALSASRFYRR